MHANCIAIGYSRANILVPVVKNWSTWKPEAEPDIASASEGYKKLSMVLAGWKDLASTCMFHLQIVFVLQFLETFQLMVNGGFRGREQV